MVVRIEVVPWWRHLLWSFIEFLDSCHDVLLLHFESAEDSVSVETVLNAGAAFAVPLCVGIFSIEYVPHARGRKLDALPCIQYPSFRDDQPLCVVPTLLFQSVQQQKGPKGHCRQGSVFRSQHRFHFVCKFRRTVFVGGKNCYWMQQDWRTP